MHMKFAFKIRFGRKHCRVAHPSQDVHVCVCVCVSTLMVTTKCEMEKSQIEKHFVLTNEQRERVERERENSIRHEASSAKQLHDKCVSSHDLL